MSGVFEVLVRKPGERELSLFRSFEYGDEGHEQTGAEIKANLCLVDWLDQHYPDQWHLAMNGVDAPSDAVRVMLTYRLVPDGQYQDRDGIIGSTVPGMIDHYGTPKPTSEQRIKALERRVEALEAKLK